MPDVAFALKDGSTTLDLGDATKHIVAIGGADLGTAQVRRGISGESFFSDGARLTEHALGPRRITLSLLFAGTNLSGLQTNVQNVNAMLTRARQRNVAGYGTAVEFQVQYGTAASMDFRVLDGQLDLDRGALNNAMTKGLKARGVLSLLCSPYGEGSAQTIAATTLYNEQDGTNLNYMTLSNIVGDGPALLRLKLTPSGQAGTGKTYIAVLTGDRGTGTLLWQGENRDSVTQIGTLVYETIASGSQNAVWSTANVLIATASKGTVGAMWYSMTANTALGTVAGETVGRFNFDLGATFPLGLYRVLAMVAFDESGGGTGPIPGTMRWGLGYSVGNLTKTPGSATAADWVSSTAATGTHELLDLGEVLLPPSAKADAENLANYQLRLFTNFGSNFSHAARPGTETGYVRFLLDYVVMLPVDQGAVILNASATAGILVDSASPQPGVYLLDASGSIVEVPSRTGGAFRVGPENTRVYIARNDPGDPSAVTWAATGTYVPQWQVL